VEGRLAELSLDTSVALRIDDAICEQARRNRSVCSRCVRDGGVDGRKEKLLVGLGIKWHDIADYGHLSTEMLNSCFPS
jgi:hypothetical protein